MVENDFQMGFQAAIDKLKADQIKAVEQGNEAVAEYMGAAAVHLENELTAIRQASSQVRASGR